MPVAQNAEEYIAKQRAALAANPECGTSHYNLGVGLLGQKKYAEAEAEFLRAVECSPTLAEAYVQLGGIRLQQGDLEGCLFFNKQAVQSRAAFSVGWGNIGFVEMQRGNVDEAIRALKKAITYNKLFIQAFATLANAYLAKGLVEESIAASQQALEIDPSFGVAHNNLAIAFLEKGDRARAAEHCEKALELGYKVAPEIVSQLGLAATPRRQD